MTFFCNSDFPNQSEMSRTTFEEANKNSFETLFGKNYDSLSGFDHTNGQYVGNAHKLLDKIASLYQNQDLSDIQIVVGHDIFHAHKLILCCASDVFRVMLTNPTWLESNRPKIVLKEEPECICVFKDFLRYLYTGQIHLTHNSVLAILMLADKYNIDDLQELCKKYMCSHLVSTIEHNRAMSWLQYSYIGGHRHLAMECYQFILWNFHKVICTHDFLMTDKDVLVSLIRRSDLVVPDEYTLFKGVARWILYQESHCGDRSAINAFHNTVLEVLSCIRFSLIPPTQLTLVRSDPLTVKFSDFVTEKIVESEVFHSSSEENRRIMASCSSEMFSFVPRNYTNEVWSTTLSIDNFSALASHEVRPLFFSTPVSAAQSDESMSWEWNVDLYPKGIHFQKCIMIGLWRNMEISGAVYNTIRLVLATKTPEKRDVEVAVLVTGVQDNVEYIRRVAQRRCMFDEEISLCHINDIVPYNDLNCPNSPYLCGTDANTFKITIVIKPIV